MSSKELSWIEKTIGFLKEEGSKTLFQICENLGIIDPLKDLAYVLIQMALLRSETEGRISYSLNDNMYYFNSTAKQ